MSPPYTQVLHNHALGGAAITTATVTVPADAWIVVRLGGITNNGATVTCTGTGLSFSTPAGASSQSVGWAGYDQYVRFFVAQAGGGGFSNTLTFDGSGADHIIYTQWEVGYFDDADISGFANGVGDDFASDASTKTLTFPSTPAATSTLLAGWLTVQTGGVDNFTAKSSPAWTVDSNEGQFSGGVGSAFQSQSYEGTDTDSQATPGASYGTQNAAALEVQASGGPPTSFSYYRAITIDHTKCGSGNSTDFPALFYGTYTWAKTVGNGGRVESANGYDLRPYADNTASTALDFQLVSYDGSTGAVEMYVKVPTLNASSDTVFYMFMGDSGITTDGSSTATWSANFDSVWHLGVNTSLSLADSTANAHTLTNNGSVGAAAAKIGYGMTNNASNKYLTNASAGVYTSGAFTISHWLLLNSFNSGVGGQGPVTFFKGPYQEYGYYTQINSDGHISFFTNQASAIQETTTAASAVGTGTQTHIAYVRSGSSVLIYVNGSDATSSAASHTNPASSVDDFAIGGYTAHESTVRVDGLIDEFRIASVARNADWIISEYNNESNPSTFYSVGTETAVGGGDVTVLPTGFNLVMSEGTFTTENDITLVGITGYEFTMSLGTPSVTTVSSDATVHPTGYGLVMSLGSVVVNINNAGSGNTTDKWFFGPAGWFE